MADSVKRAAAASGTIKDRGELGPLFDIAATIARHHVYHAGEINQLLSIARGEAWEEFEEVEENHISTVGHRVRPPWLNGRR
jgi:hypothetical protein